MVRTAQIFPFRPPRLAPSRADDGREIGLAQAMQLLHQRDRSLDSFWAAHPEAIRVGDATVDRDTLECWLGREVA